MDGVLPDSEPLHHQAANWILSEEGRPPLLLAEYTRYLGRTDEDMWCDVRSRRELDRHTSTTCSVSTLSLSLPTGSTRLPRLVPSSC